MGSIKNVVSEPIEGHEDYHMMVRSPATLFHTAAPTQRQHSQVEDSGTAKYKMCCAILCIWKSLVCLVLFLSIQVIYYKFKNEKLYWYFQLTIS